MYSNYTYPETAAGVITTLKSAGGKMDFSPIAHTVRKPRNEIARSLWELAWNMQITNDSFSSLRKGIAQKFKTDDAPDASQSRRFRSSRSIRNRWVKTLPLAGNWYVLDIDDEQKDPLEGEELNKDRVRQVLDRYGILFRELPFSDITVDGAVGGNNDGKVLRRIVRAAILLTRSAAAAGKYGTNEWCNRGYTRCAGVLDKRRRSCFSLR